MPISPERVRRRLWRYYVEHDLVLGCSPKVASTSIKEWAMGDYVLDDVRNKGVRRVFVVRDPVSRFKSLWRDKCRDGTPIRAKVHGMTPEDLMDEIEGGGVVDGVPDHHFLPQSFFHGGVDCELIPLEELTEWTIANGYAPFPKKHTTSGPVPLSDALIERVERYYAEDLKLYGTVHSGPEPAPREVSHSA